MALAGAGDAAATSGLLGATVESYNLATG